MACQKPWWKKAWTSPWLDELLDGLALEHLAVVGDGVDDLGREHEEAAVDPAAFVGGFFLEGVDLRVLEAEGAEAGDGLDAGEGGQLAVLLVEGDGGGDVDVGHAVAVGHAEGLVAFEILCDAAQTAAGPVLSPVSTSVTARARRRSCARSSCCRACRR